MAKISTYTVETPTSSDLVIGTDDVGGTNATKNFTVQGIADFATDPNNVDIVNSVTGTTPVQVTPGSGDVNVSLETVYPQPPGTITYADVTLDKYGRVISFNQNTPVESASAPDSGGGTATLTGDITFVSGTNTIITGDATNNTITIESTPAATGPGGTVTQILTAGGLTGGPISTTGTVSMVDLSAEPVNPLVPGTYDNAQVTVDEFGRVTAVSVGTGQPNQDLQSVLDEGNTAENQFIALTGSGTGFTATQGSLFVLDVDWQGTGYGNQLTIGQELELSHRLKDSAGNTGELNQVLYSDPTYDGGAGGVFWGDLPLLSARVALTATELNALTNVNGHDLIPSQGIGAAIHVVSASYSFSYNSAAYQFTNDLGLYCGNPSLSFAPQVTIDKDAINSNFNIAGNADAFQGARLLPNQPLSIFTTAGTTTTTGDGNVIMDIIYKVVSA